MNSVYMDIFNIAKSEDGTVSLSFTYVNQPISNYVLSSDGKLLERAWKVENQDWFYTWNRPETECDIYGKCGAFGSCNSVKSPICSCLRGFVPKNPDDWNKGNWTSGCIRRTPLECTETQNRSEVNPKDGFLKLEMIKVPDFAEWSSLYSELECRSVCFSNCSCIAYSYYKGIGCMFWTRSLIDIQKFSIGGVDLYLRIAYSDLDKRESMKIVISITVVFRTIAISICAFLSWRWMVKHRGKSFSLNSMSHQLYSVYWSWKNATNSFHISNMLGKGGFGPVFWGKLPDGQEIAVKRLSRASQQGLEEFMNEVSVIAKLQHRNLVQLLAYCVEGEEKMLVYDYMPNKSLDAFLFEYKQHKRKYFS
ncbi:G-type lectin S-receptor serine/threonine-protein kinase [Salix suchowensis]|nr:G-type lectin S-receptor serine/threonine-protein kinase [Salix suchowensis]